MTLRVGLSGGIASGKSTVARLLAYKGAVVIDADRLGHGLLAPGGQAVSAVVERFGSAMAGAGGGVDRDGLGAIVFADPQARRDLEAILHPLIAAETLRRLAEPHPAGAVLVVDAPLLVETGGRIGLGLDALVVVAADRAQQIGRAVSRGTAPDRAEAVIAIQAPVEVKMAAADYVIDNRGSLDDLELAVGTLWADLTSRFPADGPAPADGPVPAQAGVRPATL